MQRAAFLSGLVAMLVSSAGTAQMQSGTGTGNLPKSPPPSINAPPPRLPSTPAKLPSGPVRPDPCGCFWPWPIVNYYYLPPPYYYQPIYQPVYLAPTYIDNG